MSTHPNAAVGATIAEATNSYMEEVWLAADERYRGTIVIGNWDIKRAVEEIDRRAAFSRQWIGIFMNCGDPVMGHEYWWPVYEAAESHGLAITVHTTGAAMMYRNQASSAAGLPLYHMDFRVGLVQADQTHLATMLSSGVFVRFPKLRFVITEAGFGWVPEVMWVLDAYWKGNREETPWLSKPPSEYVFENVRFTTQPFIEPRKREHIAQMLDMIQAERTLMFATDYPL
jgi:predicted TIM-barrel fold metal-dependent hydrolase